MNGNRVSFSPDDNENGVSCGLVSVSIIDDLVVEGVEVLKLVAESADPERIIVELTDAPTITIIDNDCKKDHCSATSHSQ